MARYAALAILSVIAAVVLTGVDAAETDSSSTSPQASFGGRPVVVAHERVWYGVAENARFETVGTDTFVVFDIAPEDGAAYEHWQPIRDISNIKVFDTLADAQRYAEKMNPYERRPEPQALSPEAN